MYIGPALVTYYKMVTNLLNELMMLLFCHKLMLFLLQNLSRYPAKY